MLIENVHCYLMLIEIVKTLIIIDKYWSTDVGMLIYWYMEGCTELVCWDPWQFGSLGFYGIASVCQLPKFWVNYNELTTSSLEIIVSKGNHPQMALIQVSELL